MNVTHKITMDLTRPTNGNQINVVEGDKNSRIVNVHLYENFVSWRVPTNASVLIKWERESGVGGEYSQLSDGSSAWSAVGNILTITLSDESTEYSGNVKFSIVLTSGDSQISTFVIVANVHAVANGKEEANSGTSSSDIAGLQKQIGNLSDLETKNKSNLVAAINEAAKSGGGSGETGADGGYYTPKVSQPSAATMQMAFTPSKAGMPAVEPVTINLPVGSGSSQNVTLTPAQINVLDGMFKVCAFIKEDVSAEYNAFKTAFGITDSGGEEEPDEPVTPEKTLTGISATYSGGDVAVGTAVSALAGIVVTAHYSDGTSQTVTGYTLSGTIAEGSNTVTVAYQGMTATFMVTGVAESGGEETGVSNETTWTNEVAYTYDTVSDEYVEVDGTIKSYSGWSRTPYLYCKDASKLRFVILESGSLLTTNTMYNCFFDENKTFVSKFSWNSDMVNTVGAYSEVAIPENAAYFVCSNKDGVFTVNDNGAGPFVQIVPYA